MVRLEVGKSYVDGFGCRVNVLAWSDAVGVFACDCDGEIVGYSVEGVPMHEGGEVFNIVGEWVPPAPAP
jgi:hypothetical protein